MSDVVFIPNLALKTGWEHAPETWGMMGIVGEQIAGVAAQLAPRETGRLAESINSHPAPGPTGGAGVDVVADVEYALFVEFGTSKMAAQPFLRPALDEVL